MNTKRVVILNDSSKALGGATTLALLSARLLSEAGVEVVYVTGDAAEAPELPDNVEVVALGGKPLLELPFGERVTKGLFNRDAQEMVQQVVKKFDAPDVVYHLHGWAQILSPAVLDALFDVQDRLVIHAHDFFHACPNGTFFNFQREAVCELTPMSSQCIATNCDKRSVSQKMFRVARMMVKQRVFDFRQTSALVAMIHPFMGEWFQRAGIPERSLRVVRNPVKAFTSDRVEAEKNSELFFIGRVEPEKGAELAAEAAARAGRQLRVIGDGSDRERLAAKFPEIVWEGWCSHDEIAGLIHSARGLIMPSRLPEPFGLVSLEALQSGVPLVAFADSFVAREASELGCAFVASGRNADALADAVRALDDDKVVENASRTAFDQTKSLSSTHDSWRDELLALYSGLPGMGHAARSAGSAFVSEDKAAESASSKTPRTHSHVVDAHQHYAAQEQG